MVIREMFLSKIKVISFLLFIFIGTKLPGVAAKNNKIDISKQFQTRHDSEQFFVIFSARSSEKIGPGHAYVTWVNENSKFQRTEFEAYGFYPHEDTSKWKVIFLSGGTLRNDLHNPANDKNAMHLVIKVNSDQFNSTVSKRKSWFIDSLFGKSEYSLFFKNCITFVNDIASGLNIKIPRNTLRTPHEYIFELIQLNTA